MWHYVCSHDHRLGDAGATDRTTIQRCRTLRRHPATVRATRRCLTIAFDPGEPPAPGSPHDRPRPSSDAAGLDGARQRGLGARRWGRVDRELAVLTAGMSSGARISRLRYPTAADRGTTRSSGRARPRSDTVGSQPSFERAIVMSGCRSFGSSDGRARCSIDELEPVSSITRSASSIIVNSSGLPMFTGPTTGPSSSASSRRTSSST